MDKSATARSRADAAFATPPERGAKGSATMIIADEVKATHEKTARLKALRLAQEAVAAEEAKSAAPAKKKAAPRKKRATA
ncbi:hypothetical protein [Aurantimonas sp. Leaf443]|uniref:hypothetical protein n=1 Tax=Aurantimonas sp. Leaf443 TaxID=1736378 RepID=UPI0006FA3E39|nr:hypothetical protein [Aurantimonas sp. Leaf443]KQT83895.1 hypothetical protein ASG48_10900 [Aurantimonas sp. Leaf443]